MSDAQTFSYVEMYLVLDCTVTICDVPNMLHMTMKDRVSFFKETNGIYQMVWHRALLGAQKLKSVDLAQREIFAEQAVLLRGAEFLLPEQTLAPEQD